MKKTRKKLALHKQTLRNLTRSALRQPVGAALHYSGQICSSWDYIKCSPLSNDQECWTLEEAGCHEANPPG